MILADAGAARVTPKKTVDKAGRGFVARGGDYANSERQGPVQLNVAGGFS